MLVPDVEVFVPVEEQVGSQGKVKSRSTRAAEAAWSNG